ncbi:hypothetical protein SAMN02745217_00383 [Anaerocolumna xylanovorans DSM 12503]|uniref:Uncharacterized protein n=1 Tax=Anaerocolumna xylanovorans DSM 12503 TaxID=1121345 RepID=A0A1M7XXY8_9FIRM|nr:hypothetical protein SAMN02745217_00383 [Anaerocolumna xylanovorans DSM 12503]
MDNIFSKTCDLHRRNKVLPVNYYAMVENRYGKGSLFRNIYDKKYISICAALDRCCVM